MIWGFLLYLLQWTLGLAVTAFALKLIAIGAGMAVERVRS